MNLFVLLILGYLLYRFIAGFLFPVFRASIRMRQQFNGTSGGTNGTAGSQPDPGSAATDKSETSKSGSKVGEYIDFEEIK
jgi:hypothetical protein